MQLVAEPYIPFALWISLALLAAVVLTWYALTSRIAVGAWMRAAIVALMVMTVALPLILLLNLTWIEHVPPPAGKPVVRVLVDTSASMLTADVDDETRLQAAQSIAAEAVEQLEDQFDVQVSTFDGKVKVSDVKSVAGVSATDVGTETNLATAMSSMARHLSLIHI